MQITTIVYKRLHSFGNYCNEEYRLEAAIEEGDSVAESIANLRRMIADQIATSGQERKEAEEEYYRKLNERRFLPTHEEPESTDGDEEIDPIDEHGPHEPIEHETFDPFKNE